MVEDVFDFIAESTLKEPGALMICARTEGGVGSFCCVSDLSVDEVGFACRIWDVSARCAAFIVASCTLKDDVEVAEDSERCRPFLVGFSPKNLDLDGYRPEGSGQARKAETGKN
jgi:hypothetical protein